MLGRRRHLWGRGWEGAAAAGWRAGWWRSWGARRCLRSGEGSFRSVRGRVRDWVWGTDGSARHCIAGRGGPGVAAEGACSRSGSTKQGHTWPKTRWVWLRLSVVRKGMSALEMFRHGFAHRGSSFCRCQDGKVAGDGVVDKAGIGRHGLTCSGSANLHKTARSEPGHMRKNNQALVNFATQDRCSARDVGRRFAMAPGARRGRGKGHLLTWEARPGCSSCCTPFWAVKQGLCCESCCFRKLYQVRRGGGMRFGRGLGGGSSVEGLGGVIKFKGQGFESSKAVKVLP